MQIDITGDIIQKRKPKNDAYGDHNEGVLTKKEKFIFTLVRTRKGFGMKFLADSFWYMFH